jgi:hypothetical protein
VHRQLQTGVREGQDRVLPPNCMRARRVEARAAGAAVQAAEGSVQGRTAPLKRVLQGRSTVAERDCTRATAAA